MAVSRAPSPVGVLIGRAAFLLGISAGIVLAALNWSTIGTFVGPECTVGLTSTSATVTVKGWTAGEACAEVRLRIFWPSIHPDGVLALPIVCRYQRRDRLYTVRDDGALKIAGTALCAILAGS